MEKGERKNTPRLPKNTLHTPQLIPKHQFRRAHLERCTAIETQILLERVDEEFFFGEGGRGGTHRVAFLIVW